MNEKKDLKLFSTNWKRRYRENLQAIKNKNRRVFEIVAVTAVTLAELERIRKIVDEGGEIHGWETVIKGTWHSDPNGNEIAPITKERGYYTYETIIKDKHNLLTNGGRDFIHNQAYTNTAVGTRGSGFVAVSADVGAPAATDTTLAGEIATGGFARADADTKSHTNGTNVTTIQHTFTATALQTAVVKSALFNAATVGTMTHENTFTTVTCQINDTLQVTWTLTLG